MEEINVGKVIISKQNVNCDNYQRFKKIVNDRKIKVMIVDKGDELNIEKNLSIDFLWPSSNQIIMENELNNNSIVCKLKYKSFSMLFTGDIEEKAEKQIIDEYKNNSYLLISTVLKVAHHGSKTSSITEFINSVNPKVSLIGVGENNIFGHPNKEVIERLKKQGTKIYRTDENGEITMAVNKKGKIRVQKLIK